MVSDAEKHTINLGKLVSNLQSLEFLLRGFLSTIYDAGSGGLLPGMPVDMYSLGVGDTVPLNHMTNYDTLGIIIDKYNEYVKRRDVSLLIDKQALVELRDAIAHGRVSAPEPSMKLQILKFNRPDRSGHVRVVFSQTMDAEWFKSHIRLVHDSVKTVYSACKLFAQTMIP